jgi:hypothetical protein
MLIIRRGIVPAVFLILGLASLIYGARFHRTSVLTKEKSEISIDVPSPFSEPPFPGARPFGEPPGMKKKTVTQTIEVVILQPEPAMIRDVTIGGVVLNKSGNIERTYSGKPPSLCPT